VIEFEFDGLCWTAQARLPNWAGYQAWDDPYGLIRSDRPSDGSVTIIISPEDRDESPPTAGERAAVQWLLDHGADVAPAVLDGLWTACAGLRKSPGDANRQVDIPDLASPADLRSHVGLQFVHVHPAGDDGLPRLGYQFGCAWDEEHGLGVLMQGPRVVGVGAAATALFPWSAGKTG